MKGGAKENRAGAVATAKEHHGLGGKTSSGKINSSGTRTARHMSIAMKIGVSDILEEMIQRAQEQQDSQTSLIISTHRGRKGRRGGIEFKVQKVKRNSMDEIETVIGNAQWQPESSVSQSKITEYWEAQMNPAQRVYGAHREKPIKTEISTVSSDGANHQAELFEEGNHGFIYRELRSSGSSGESQDKRYKVTERTYPEMAHDEIEFSHCFNYGNWRKMKSKQTKSTTVWKCIDCGFKMHKHVVQGGVGNEHKVSFSGNGSESSEVPMHAWFDKKHTITKQKRKRSDTPLYPSVQAIFEYYEKTGKAPVAGLKKADLPLVQPKEVSPKELLSMLKRDFPRLYAEFGPTETQIRQHLSQQQALKMVKSEEPEEADASASPQKPDETVQKSKNQLGFSFCPGNFSDSSSRSPINVADGENVQTDKLILISSDSEDRQKDQSLEQQSDGQRRSDSDKEQEELEAIDQLLNASMVCNLPSAPDEPKKSIMKKPGTPVPYNFSKRTHAQTNLNAFVSQDEKSNEDGISVRQNAEEDSESLQVIGFPVSNISTKRVKFNQNYDRVHEFEVQSSEDDEILKKKEEKEADESLSMDSEEFSEEICGSDDEDMEKGLFFDYIERERMRQEAERKYIVYKLKSKQRVGSIFIDKVKRVIAAIQREQGKYDYLIEWEFHPKDKLKPTTSIVKGSHFVFAKPLLFRRYIETSYLCQKSQSSDFATSQPVIYQSPSDKRPKILSQDLQNF